MRTALLACTLALAASGCSARPQPITHTVIIEGMKFQPESLTLRVGDSVTWINRDLFPHTATSTKDGLDSGDIAAEKSWSYKATKRGDIGYGCAYHPMMKAALKIMD